MYSQESFESYLGSFQGDCLSGKLFTLVLAGALNQLHEVLSTLSLLSPDPTICSEGMPCDSAYADDVDFINTDKDTLEAMFPVIKETFQQWNLFINDAKTDFTHVFVAPKGTKVVGRSDTALCGNEEWRTHKILGSLLCSEADVKARCIAGNIAFNKFKAIWSGQNLSLDRKLAVYEAQVVSVILYNSGS